MTNRDNKQGGVGTHITNGKPNEFTTITPFIAVNDPAGAISFYETVFGATARSVTSMDVEGRSLIVHAELDFGHGFLQLGAANPQFRLVLPPGDGDACYSLGIYVPDVDQTFALAVANGAMVREELNNFVSGDRYCSILDPYGIRWSIMTRIEDISVEESYRRVDEWSKSFGE